MAAKQIKNKKGAYAPFFISIRLNRIVLKNILQHRLW